MTNAKLSGTHITDLEIRRGGHWDRRQFVQSVAALAGSTALLGYDLSSVAAEPPPETARIRLTAAPAICLAPQYVAEALLKAEGFTDVRYVKIDTGLEKLLASGEVDITLDAVGPLVTRVDAGAPVVVLAGVHLGCYELFGTDRVRAIRDLKGKTVPVWELGNHQHILLSSMAAHIGLDPRKDIHWIERTFADSMRLLAEGKVDAFMGFPPEPQELRAKKIGHVVVNTRTDKPWSQYYCCMLAGNREFVSKYPVATKRALRAILKAADICAQEPELAARLVVDRGFTSSYDYAVQALNDVSYKAWRTYDPENTMRFYALRLHEVGMIKSSPQKLITQGTDWRFLNELKKELKA